MPVADTDGVSLFYEIEGPADGETVVFVAGLGYGRWMWRWQRTALSDSFQTIAWDNRGAGDSDTPNIPWYLTKLPATLRKPLIYAFFGYTIPEMAADLEAVLDDAGVESAHVVGASMGGMIAQQYALEYDRAKTVTLMCSTNGGPDSVPIPDETQERMFEEPDGYDERETIRHKMSPAVTDEFMAEHDSTIEDIVDWRLESDASEVARESQATGVLKFDSSDRLSEIDQPTLVLHGTEDQVLPVENADLLYEQLPNSERHYFEGGPHLFFIEQADAVNDRLRTFLNNA